MRLVNWRALVVGAVGFGLAACGDDVTVTPPAPTITVNPQSVTCSPGQTTAVGVTVSGGSNTSIAFAGGTGVTVTPSGASGATVVCGNTPGAAVITVTVTSNGQQYTSSIPVTITGGTSVLAVTISQGSATVSVGGTAQLAATVSLAPGAPANTATTVTWSSGDPTIATVNATTGVVTGVKAGQTTITATSTANTGLKASIPVTVTAQSLVTSLTLGSSTLSLQVGQTSQVAAQVTLAANAPAGTSTGVTCTSSTTTVATISGGTTSPCTITAVGAGQSVIVVRSVADTNVRQTIGLTVGALAPVRLTVSNISNVGPTGPSVDLNNVTGNLFVTMNLDPGDNRPDSVVVTIGGQRVNCQTFTSSLQLAYRAAIQNGSADVQPITCQLNTSQFNATTGAVLVQNGKQPLAATVFFHSGTTGTGPGTAQTATIQQDLTVANQSGFFVNVTNTPSAAQAAVNAQGQATGPQGVLWRAGAVNVTVLPVNFTPVVNPGTQSFTVSLQDAVNGVVAQRTATQTAGAATFSATFEGASADVADFTPAVTDRVLNGYTSPNAGVAPAFNPQGQYIGGGTLVVIGTQAGTGNTAILNAAGQPAGFGGNFGNTVAAPIFVDNQNPQPAVNFGGANGPPNANFANTGTSFVGFVNGAFNFQNSLTPQFFTTANNAASALVGSNPDFGGVDRVTTQFFAGSSTSANTLAGGTAITTGSQLSPNPSNTAFNLAVRMVDALGNARNQRVGTGTGGVNLTIDATGTAVSGNNFVSFGVDIAPPTISQTAGQTANATVNTNANQTFQFAGSDETGFGTNPILITMSRTARSSTGGGNDTNSPTGAPSTYCATAIDAGGNVTFSDNAGGTCNPIATPGTVIIPAGLNGQYSITAQARDQAGNVSGTVNRIILVDTKAPVIGGVGLPQTITGNAAATFPTSATDNLEIGAARGEVDYAAVLAFQFPEQTLGTAFDNVFTGSINPINITIPQFVRSITTTTGTTPNATRQPATNFRAVVLDVAGNLAFSNLPIPIGNLGNLSGTSPFVSANPVSNVTFFASNAVVGNNAPASTVTISGSGANNVPTTATINTYQLGAQNVFISPFSRIELYVQVPALAGAPTTYRFIGTVPAGLVQDNPATAPGQRQIQSIFTLTPTTSPLIVAPTAGTNTYNIVAVGITSNGDALVAAPVTVNVVP
jgi:uncharacterized protein YjdB